MSSYIKIRGAKAHNLQGVDVDIPRGKFVVVTGLSGSGKSSLAFDTLYAEGQRRYMDTLSTYAKHFMGILEKPEVESITGLSPIIAIEQKTTGNNPRSTVGTITEIFDFLRLLFAKASTAYSPESGEAMVRYTDEQIIDLILTNFQGRKCYLLAPLVRGRKGHYRDLFEQLRKRGYTQVRIDGELCNLNEIDALDRYKAHFIELLVDKLKPSPDDGKRIRDSVMTALNAGKGSVAVMDLATGELTHYSKHFVDPVSGISLPEPQPHTFSFNSPEGYCPHCKGLGMIVDVNLDTLIPDRSLSIAEGGIVPLGKVRETRKFDVIRAIARKYNFSLYDPIAAIPDEAISHIIFGSDDLFRVGEGNLSEMVTFDGIVEDIDEKVVCPVCGGTRLGKHTECFRIDGKTIAQVASWEMTELKTWLEGLPEKLNDRQRRIARDILKELNDRVGFMLDVGLDYLSLDRATGSLSGGESQRIRLATQIGSQLVNVLYILDEPSIGLHARDTDRLIHVLKDLQDLGNTVVVVEHDEEIMRAADYLIDIGPDAGRLGGEVVFHGNAKDITISKGSKSYTVKYLLHEEEIPVPTSRRPWNLHIDIKGARMNNLRGIDVAFPLNVMTVVTGVSGSGKSSLIKGILYPSLKRHLGEVCDAPGEYLGIDGDINALKHVEFVDQNPIGKSTRSNPATYVKAYDAIRDLYADQPLSQQMGFTAQYFSFNTDGGRCEECKGAGVITVEMQFMADLVLECEACHGHRFKHDILDVKFEGKNIDDVLNMTITEALEFFREYKQDTIVKRLKSLEDVGLGYIKLGQSSSTLSGGENQRVKLAYFIGQEKQEPTLFIFDEPTTGLHFHDIHKLLDAFNALIARGHTILIIEHNMEIIKCADYVIDLGPDGGDKGGALVAKGTPEEIARCPESFTGQYLKSKLNL